MGLYGGMFYERVKHAKHFDIGDCLVTGGVLWVIVDPVTWLQYAGIALVALIAGLPSNIESDWRDDV